MLVTKQITITSTPVELLAGEDTSQAYALHFGQGRGSGLVIGDSAVTTTTGYGPSDLADPLLLQGVSLWAVAVSADVSLNILAYSTPGE